MKMSHVRAQKKGQNARQAMVISGLSTIYRNTAASHAIKSHRQTEPRIYFLDISIVDINTVYPKLRQIITKNSGIGTSGRYIVKTQTEHLLITDSDIYEIILSKKQERDCERVLQSRVPIDGIVSIKEIIAQDMTIPVLIDESYYELHESDKGIQLPPNHLYHIQVKKTIKFHATSPHAFIFVFDDESEHNIIDFYMTTESGIISQSDKLNNSFKEDMISFLLQFKLCS